MGYLVGGVLVLVCLAIERPGVQAETEYFPGLRKPPAFWKPGNDESNAIILAKLATIIEEQSRRRFEQNQHQLQLAQQLFRQQEATGYPKHRLHHLHQQREREREPFRPVLDWSAPPPRDALGFTYQFPIAVEAGVPGKTPFAVRPDDPRYYQPSDTEESEDAVVSREIKSKDAKSAGDGVLEPSAFVADYAELLASGASAAALQTDGDGGDHENGDDIMSSSYVYNAPSYQLKVPMEIKANANPQPATHKMRADINSLVQKLQNTGQAGAIINEAGDNAATGDEHVMRKQLEMNGMMVDLYVVAIIAGISATVSVGLIAIGVGWYSLHKKSAAAADVEYPAYGVTGPNKDLSPPGDRRLAQSAQMYHYQHQKQQIIAMESNRTHGEHRNGSMTDAESDEENEEGDYTVYECPGLAPTGEMEVKNPLFLDDPTPATPAASAGTAKAAPSGQDHAATGANPNVKSGKK